MTITHVSGALGFTVEPLKGHCKLHSCFLSHLCLEKHAGKRLKFHYSIREVTSSDWTTSEIKDAFMLACIYNIDTSSLRAQIEPMCNAWAWVKHVWA